MITDRLRHNKNVFTNALWVKIYVKESPPSFFFFARFARAFSTVWESLEQAIERQPSIDRSGINVVYTLWLDQFQASPPPPPGYLSGIFSLLIPTVGYLTKQVSPGVTVGGALISSDFKSSNWFHSNMCKYLHNCFHLQIRDHKKKNVHGLWKSCSFSC